MLPHARSIKDSLAEAVVFLSGILHRHQCSRHSPSTGAANGIFGWAARLASSQSGADSCRIMWKSCWRCPACSVIRRFVDPGLDPVGSVSIRQPSVHVSGWNHHQRCGKLQHNRMAINLSDQGDLDPYVTISEGQPVKLGVPKACAVCLAETWFASLVDNFSSSLSDVWKLILDRV